MRNRYLLKNISFKTIFLGIVIFSSLFGFFSPTQPVSASEKTYPVTVPTTLTYRDISDLTFPADPVVTLDSASYAVGDTALVTIVDSQGNLDTTDFDTISATLVLSSGTSPLSLSETPATGVNSDTFTDSFTVTEDFEVTYTGPFLEEGRLEVTLDLATAGDVKFSDEIITASAAASLCFDPVTHIVNVELLSGATLGATDTTVIMSYANALFGAGQIADETDLWYKAPGAGWVQISDFTIDSDGSSRDFFAKTIKSDLAETVYGMASGTITEGKFVIGTGNGCSGGGGGGLVRAGLVVNALAGLSAAVGGGGGGPPGPTVTLGAVALSDAAVEIILMPQEIRDMALNQDPHIPQEGIIDTFEEYDLPFSFMGYGFVLGGYETTIETQIVEPGVPIEFVVVYYTNSEVAHSELNFNLGPTRTIAGSDTQVILDIDKPPEIVDPNGNIASFTGSINNEGDLKRVATFLVTLSETAEFPNPDIVIRTWTTQLSSGDTIIYDAIEIAQPEIVEITDEDIPEPEIQTLKSQYVPIWIKNNAAWWSQELIEDSDFVAGIEYLIQNEIITIQDNQVSASSYSSNEIPEWIKNNAGWWSEDLITEKEFIDGLQWLVNNGIIQVTEN